MAHVVACAGVLVVVAYHTGLGPDVQFVAHRGDCGVVMCKLGHGCAACDAVGREVEPSLVVRAVLDYDLHVVASVVRVAVGVGPEPPRCR